MNYEIKPATENDIPRLIDYKLKNIMMYADKLSDEELNKINKYVKTHIPMQLEDYKMINVKNNIVGCVLVISNVDGLLLDEIYLEGNYRNKGIGTDIIKKIILNHNSIYLWVYKLNKKAISLYKKLGFKIIKETETRYYMKYVRKS